MKGIHRRTDSLLAQAASPSADIHKPALKQLLRLSREIDHPELNLFERLRIVLLREWEQAGNDRLSLVRPLVERFAAPETDFVEMEIIAAALAMQGDAGISALLWLLESGSFVFRHKAAIGLSLADRSARWAAPAVARALLAETEPAVQIHLFAALGNIGGRDAVFALDLLYDQYRSCNSPLASSVEAALVVALVTE